MRHVDVQSIQDSVRQGTLVELSSDYRTSRTVRSYLADRALCAMSTTAFRQCVLQGTAGERESRVDAMCAVLSDELEQCGDAARPWFAFSVQGNGGRPASYRLKLEWFAPNNYWVVLLPEESLRTVSTK